MCISGTCRGLSTLQVIANGHMATELLTLGSLILSASQP